ncbi:MAG: hypothetical protein JEZ07_12125 [Phycisphaerae bacterium]|nr:hypothetical protein [Phycisphaerae bacterium]
MDRVKRQLIALSILLMAFIAGGCSNSIIYTPKQEAKFVKPTVAVVSFVNQAPVDTKWMLGEGIADLLVNRLMATKRYEVLERIDLKAVFNELNYAKDDRFSKKNSPALGRLKHVDYIIKGVITDFGHVETVSGFWRLFDWGLFGTSSYAIVAADIRVIDITTGQIIASTHVESKIKDKKNKDKVQTPQGNFGSYTFYQTTLGQATDKMLEEAVRQIAAIIAEMPWHPFIADKLNGQIIINGGENRLVDPETIYVVRSKPEVLRDPETGDMIGRLSESVVGSVRVIQVADKYAVCEILQGTLGDFEVGQVLFKVDSKDSEQYTNPHKLAPLSNTYK